MGVQIEQKKNEFNSLDGKFIKFDDVRQMYTTFESSECNEALKEMQRNYPNGEYKTQCRGKDFREQSKIITDRIVKELLKDIPEEDRSKVVLALPWRAGLAFVDSFKEAGINNFYHFDIQRNEDTAEPEFKTQHGQVDKDSIVILADPMLATGGSATRAIKLLKEQGAENITMASVVAAPVGVARMDKVSVKVLTAFLHDELNENAYIVPGLGDYGDKYFDSMSKEDFKKFITEKCGLNLDESAGQDALARFIRHKNNR